MSRGNLIEFSRETLWLFAEYPYLSRLLDALSLKAVIVRPGLDGWNDISRKRTLEDMLQEIGEPGRGYVKKGSRK